MKRLADDSRIGALAEYFVDSGRVVPGISVDADGRARSWWWPLPTASDRGSIAALCADGSLNAQRAAAGRLEREVDRVVRSRITTRAAEASIEQLSADTVEKSVEETWLESLFSKDPWLHSGFGDDIVSAFAQVVEAWVASGAATMRRTRLCVRVREPAPVPALSPVPAPISPKVAAEWSVEFLVADESDQSLLVPALDVWRGQSPFGAHAQEDLLAGLGRLVRLAPELAGALDEAEPSEVWLTTQEVLDLVSKRGATLVDAGIGVLLPAWWTQRRRLGLRAKASSSRSGADAVASGGLGMQALVSFRWEAALGDQTLTKADLRALNKAVEAKQSLVRIRGEWVELRSEDLAAVAEHVGRSSEATVAQLLRTGLGLDDLSLSDGIETTGVSATGWLGDLLGGALHATVTPVLTPPGFVGELRPYQERGTGWLTFLGRLGLGACLADDMGLGKTPQLIATVLADPAPGPTLIVCPVSVLGNWQRELEKFAPQLKVIAHHGTGRFSANRSKFATRAKNVDIVLTTYSLMARDLNELNKVQWARLVLDEAQQVKNPGTAVARAVARIEAPRRIALTGTPVENRLSELWSIMHILNPGLLGTSRGFRDRFAIPIERDHDLETAERLRAITAPFVLRRLKTDKSIIDDLPDKIETTEHCPLTREQATLYRAVVDDLIERAEEAQGIGRRGLVLAGLIRLKQVCNHPAHFLGDGSSLPGRSGKLTRTEELIEEIVAAGDKVLCFTQFAQWGKLLAPYWTRKFGVDVAWLYGGVPRAKRDAMVERFQSGDGPGIFLISLKAGGTGLNLTAASHVIHLDRWWNPAVEDQATDRAYRIGQRRAVLVHKLVSTGTIEERIDAMILQKRALAEQVIGTGEQWITELSTEDLRETIALSATVEEEDE